MRTSKKRKGKVVHWNKAVHRPKLYPKVDQKITAALKAHSQSTALVAPLDPDQAGT